MKINKIIKLNLFAGFLHLAQAVLVLLISNNFTQTITVGYLKYDPELMSLVPAEKNLFEVRIATLVALFFLLSAFAHFYVSTVGKTKYINGLKKGINKYRWYEYSLSASLMIVLIAMLSGIFNFYALAGLFALSAIMNLMGLMMEVHNQDTKKTNWLSYNIGVLAGAIPWVLIGVALWVSQSSAAPGFGIPSFVYAIFVSIFIFFNAFALNMYLQYKQVGKWQDYLYGEKVYIILSLVAKSALAWQIYAGTLQP